MYAGKCDRLCRNRNYRYFGLQHSKECWCGNSYGKYGARQSSECRMRCSGNRGSYCGSSWRNSIYATTKPRASTRLPLSKCSQHSVDFNGKCSRAIDGDTNQNYRKKSCTHTRTATGAWWQARTSRRARITSVRIYNRQDCCANRLRNFVIKVDGQVCASYHSSSAFSVKTFRCNAVGRTVRIETRNRVPLTLCEVKVYGRYAEVSTARLPLSKCSQHSVDFNGKCSRAIDGDTNQNYRKKSCTHTRTATGAWWQARTSRRARITSVRIYNRQDCCANRLRNFVIKVDGQVCASYHSSSAFSVKTFRCNAVGRTVRIETRNRVPLTLCEVKVYGRYAEVSTARLPLSKCSQNSVDFNGKCSRAIDGDTNQNYRKKSCTHTRTATGAWWQARTSRRARITSVRIYNRQDCCANRLRNFVIKVDGQVCASYHSSSAFSVKTFRCNAVGRTVRIETRNRVPLTLCEVKVYGRYAEVSTEFLGCYPDDPEFPDFIVAKVSALMTVWKCNKICKAKKFSYFGVKNGQICGCGNEYGNSGDTVKANCNVACGGNPDEKCGGSTNNSVFEVK
uniref:WSC domain-containing protein n=1 Tax=Macrostomum lignano TaxID=282301 RepID=A0A1I8JI29_9PLAT